MVSFRRHPASSQTHPRMPQRLGGFPLAPGPGSPFGVVPVPEGFPPTQGSVGPVEPLATHLRVPNPRPDILVSGRPDHELGQPVRLYVPQP